MQSSESQKDCGSEPFSKRIKMTSNTKTAITILTELMLKLGSQVDFELIYQGGPPHQMTFKYQCTGAGVSVIATGRSKKETKQEAAQMCLDKLVQLGKYQPAPVIGAPFAPPSPQRTLPTPPEDGGVVVNSYVALLREYCEEYHLQAPIYDLVSDSGPPHCRQFEIKVSVGGHFRSAIGSTKKVARQVAAQKLYLYLKENLHNVTSEFNETDALVRASQKAQQKFLELEEDMMPWRPNLGQRLSEHHLVLKQSIDDNLRIELLDLIQSRGLIEPVDKVEQLLKKLELEFEWINMPSTQHNHVVTLLNVPRAVPSFTIASPPNTESEAKTSTALQTMLYLETMLR